MAESSHIYRLVRALAYGFCRLGFGLRSEGSEHLPPGEPYLLISNHASLFDPILVACATSRQ
ncbi:MAG: lysophospholipid acyltransferase family protein, partial [Planctomycetota bacterium]